MGDKVWQQEEGIEEFRPTYCRLSEQPWGQLASLKRPVWNQGVSISTSQGTPHFYFIHLSQANHEMTEDGQWWKMMEGWITVMPIHVQPIKCHLLGGDHHYSRTFVWQALPSSPISWHQLLEWRPMGHKMLDKVSLRLQELKSSTVNWICQPISQQWKCGVCAA